MPTKLTVYFQEIVRDDGVRFDLRTVLDTIAGLPLAGRNTQIGADVVRIESAVNGVGCRVYDLVKLRMNDQAETGRLAVASTPLPMGDDQGLAERTVFAVPDGTNVVAACRTIYGLRAEGIARYVSSFMQGQPALNASVVQTEDPIARAEDLQTVRKLVFTVSRAALDQVQSPGVRLVRRKLDGLLGIGGAIVTVELSLGRRRNGTLDQQAALEIVRGLYRTDAVDRLCITGATEDRVRDTIDFMTNRMTEEIEINLPAGQRGVLLADRTAAVVEAIRRNTRYLQRFGNNREV